MSRGLFVTFEGIEGSGKSTQHRLLVNALKARGAPVVSTREPGGTRIGDRIRRLLLDPGLFGMTGQAEALLYAASRTQLVHEVINPSLDEGKVVVSDRFLDSAIAYQVYGRGLPETFVRAINEQGRQVVPDITFLVDIDAAVGLARATATKTDRIEMENLDFHRRVRDAFLGIAETEPARFRILNGALPEEELHEIVVKEIEALIEFREL
ncbi:MAG: dTMP kinase [Actinobacteria bacterium]|nr:dTMP kinase [Actinomycetota bacterium]